MFCTAIAVKTLENWKILFYNKVLAPKLAGFFWLNDCYKYLCTITGVCVCVKGGSKKQHALTNHNLYHSYYPPHTHNHTQPVDGCVYVKGGRKQHALTNHKLLLSYTHNITHTTLGKLCVLCMCKKGGLSNNMHLTNHKIFQSYSLTHTQYHTHNPSTGCVYMWEGGARTKMH